MRNLIAFALLGFLSIGNNVSAQEAVIEPVAETGKDSPVPREKIIYSVLPEPSECSLEELDAFYRQDILVTAPIYDADLKNMWFTLLNDRVAADGTDEQKQFYLTEQINLKNNLPNIKGFYTLLKSCGFIKGVRKSNIAADFVHKNRSMISSLEWKDDEEKNAKMQELKEQNTEFNRTAN